MLVVTVIVYIVFILFIYFLHLRATAMRSLSCLLVKETSPDKNLNTTSLYIQPNPYYSAPFNRLASILTISILLSSIYYTTLLLYRTSLTSWNYLILPLWISHLIVVVIFYSSETRSCRTLPLVYL